MITPIPYEKNAKKHSAAQLYKLALSIKGFGWQQPIVLDKDHVIIVGHGRWMAYEKYKAQMNLNEPEIRIAENLTEEQVKAYRLFDNLGSSADYDMDLVLQESNQLGLAFQEMLRFEAVDTTKKEDKQEEDNITDEAMLSYLNRSVRQVVLHYTQETYVPLFKKMEALNNMLGCKTNSELFEKLVNEKHEEIISK